MSSSTKAYKDRNFLAVIGDEDSVTGLLLAGIGHVSDNDGEKRKNFLVVDSKTSTEKIEKAFEDYTTREDIAVLLINQHVGLSASGGWALPRPVAPLRGVANKYMQIADKIRYRVDTYSQAFPALLEIPSKDHPYDPEKDSVLRRVRRLFGE